MVSFEKYEALRDNAGLTDYAVMKECGLKSTVIYDWKRGKSTPKVETLYRLSGLFGVPIEAFITDEK